MPPYHPNCKCKLKIYDSGGNIIDVAEKRLKDSGKEESYLTKTLKQILLGNYADKTTLAGTIGQIALGFTGIDAVADVRDIWYDLTHWEPTWEHFMQTLLDSIGLMPMVGALKNIDEAADLIKHSDDIIDGVGDIIKRSDDVVEGVGKVNFDSKKLLESGNQLDKGGELTKAGRALQKHGSRPGSIYPPATGNVANKNALGHQTLDSILSNPNATFVTRHHAMYGDILEIKIPGGMGVRFSADGTTFIGFLE